MRDFTFTTDLLKHYFFPPPPFPNQQLYLLSVSCLRRCSELIRVEYEIPGHNSLPYTHWHIADPQFWCIFQTLARPISSLRPYHRFFKIKFHMQIANCQTSATPPQPPPSTHTTNSTLQRHQFVGICVNTLVTLAATERLSQAFSKTSLSHYKF